MEISLVTIVKNRRAAIVNMVRALERCIHKPSELIVMHMDEKSYLLPTGTFPIIEHGIKCDHHLPLAAARNAAVACASYEMVIFLDADCIPAVDFLRGYSEAFCIPDLLISGRVRYLPAPAMEKTDFFENLMEYSVPDPVRQDVNQYPYELFWSLNFGCSKSVFQRIGGFDESFLGYGAEDTDFAFSARAAGVPLKTIDAMAFHQYHPSYDPPINHLKDIISNAKAFRMKWGIWPMEGWLAKFQQAGLVRWSGEEIALLRMPSGTELEQALKIT